MSIGDYVYHLLWHFKAVYSAHKVCVCMYVYVCVCVCVYIYN